MPESLNTWVKRISEQEIPIFKYTATAIARGVDDEDTSTAQLAQIILRDTSLTARILRIANSATYNPTHTPISTINRAIVFVGFNLVRDLSLSLAVIDAILGEKPRKHVLELMARSFHAATLTSLLAEKRGDDAPEEVFIATLLSHLGEMAFWCIAEDKGRQIQELMDKRGFSAEMAQREILGFTFDDLTVGLTRDWHLCDLLHSAINNPNLSNPRIQDIVLSKTLADNAATRWDSRNTKQTVHRIAQHLQISDKQALSLLHENAKHAAEIAKHYGAGSIIQYLPIPEGGATLSHEEEFDVGSKFPEPDPLLQLNILRDLASTLETQPNLNTVLEIVLEGLYRGVGLDRTLFALLSPDKTRVIGKYAFGNNNDVFTQRFSFSAHGNTLFAEVFRNAEPLWVQDSQSKKYAELINEDIRHVLASEAFLLYPLTLKRQAIGLFYADRQPSHRPLNAETFASFKHFCQQACLALEHISPRK